MESQLTETQLEILRTLVKLYKEKKRMIKSKEVAEALNKDEGTVRNMIMWLKGLGLVESRTGPAGGYRPTLKAFRLVEGGLVPSELGYGEAVVWDRGREVRLRVLRLELLNVLSSGPLTALARTSPGVTVEKGARIRVVSKPIERIILEGVVADVTRETGELLVKVNKLVVIPDAPVGEIGKKRLITLRTGTTIRDAAKTLTDHGIRGAPVLSRDGRIAGFMTTTDIARLVAEGVSPEEPVDKYMRKHVFSISETESIIEAMRLMDFHGVGRLLVISSDGAPVGIITRTDILRYIASLQRS